MIALAATFAGGRATSVVATFCTTTVTSGGTDAGHFAGVHVLRLGGAGAVAGTGLACTFAVQAMVNMSVAVRLLPAKGMTLPFVSYGGSSLIAGGILVGILLSLTRVRPQGEIADHLIRSRR